MKGASDVLAASAEFLERCREDERAEIIERLCQSAASAPNSCIYNSAGEVVGYSPEYAAKTAEICARIDLFESDLIIGRMQKEYNVAMFPDLYGEWVYQPC